ncbi:hypothetical protein [Actinomadura sp. NPDC048394]|uniref:hypothetical protein n=1 Tax=Actinomadura sp. NPDC048394 TaxID=3158223 RepID=UPI0033E0A391
MPRGPARNWTAVAEHTQQALPFVRAAVQYGHDVELQITEVAEGDVIQLRRGLFNAAKLHNVSIHVHAARQKDGTYTLTYAVHSKRDGRAHILEKHGEDRTRWPYNPRHRKAE